MSAGKHTAGPWFTFANGTCVGGPVGILGNPSGADTAGIAHCGMALRTGDELQANARLIAAAPELKAVAENFEITGPDDDGLVWLVLHGNGTTGKAMFNLGKHDKLSAQVALYLDADRRAAIAKATGAEADPQPIPVGEAQDSDFGAFQAAAS